MLDFFAFIILCIVFCVALGLILFVAGKFIDSLHDEDPWK